MTSMLDEEARALELLDAGKWEEGLDLLDAVGAAPRVPDVLQRVVLRMLARGDLIRLRGCVASLRAGDRALALRIADLDAATRLHAADLSSLDAVAEEAGAQAVAGGTDHRWWVEAIRAEHFLWRGDPAAFPIALQALAAMPDDAVLPTATLAARGRLRRIAAVAELFAYSAEGPARAFATLDAAVTDLSRAGWEEERCVSAGLVHTLWTAVSHDDVGRTQAVLGEAADRLEVLRSPYLPIVQVALAFVSLIGADLPTVHRALDAAIIAGADEQAVAWCDYIASLCGLIGEGPTAEALDRMDAAVDGFRLHWPEAAGSVCSTVAAVLLDFGAMDEAARWHGRAQATTHVTPYSSFDRDLTGMRLDILRSGAPHDVTRVDELLAAMRAVGLSRDAAWKSLRVAHDCVRAGLLDDARRLHAEGRRGLEGGPVSVWEALFGRPLTIAADVSSGDAEGDEGGTVVLLAPSASIRSGSANVELQGANARLLAVLAEEQRPVPADRLIERLWPEVDPAAGRNRLRVSLHRLRKAAGDDVPVVRRGDDVALAGTWRVDTWRFAELSGGDVDARLEAWQMYVSPVCATQLAYDDAVMDYRERLHARWLDLTRQLVADGTLDPATAANRAESLGVDDPDTALALAGALGKGGHTARADVWRRLAEA